MDNGNFLEYAGAQLGVDVGYGKCILVYGEKRTILSSDLTSDGVNGDMTAGTIIGVIRGWHTVAGAPVGEISVERPGTSEMKLVREEIAADVLTFEANLQNRAVIADLVKAGSLNCLLIDDQGNVFGEYNVLDGLISTMLLNFSTKVTSSFQRDNATDKTIAVTVRYLVKELDFVAAGVEAELINSKVKAEIRLTNLVYSTVADATTVAFTLISKKTGEILTDITAVQADVSVILDGNIATIDSLAFNANTGEFAVSITTASAAMGTGSMLITLSGADYYVEQIAMPNANV